MHILHRTNIDFLRWRWQALALSALVILGGLGVIFTRGIPLGIEFSGGTAVRAQFEQEPSIERIREVMVDTFGQAVVVHTYGDPDDREVMIRIPEMGVESGTDVASKVPEVEEALRAANVGFLETRGSDAVGPAIGQELRTRGIMATVLALGGILVYITLRYQFSFAVGAVAATIHDLLVVVAFLAFFQYDLTLNVIAAILTVAGYSSNDTIVIFDRVRENLRSMRRDSLPHVINTAINQTLGRTIITAGTTLMASLALFLFGGEVLRGFAFTLIVGVMTGTYSTVFIAAAIVTLWRGRGGTAKVADRAPASPSPAAPQQPTRKSKPQRKARAS